MGGVTITDTDHGYARLRDGIKSARGAVRVGVDDRPHAPSGIPTDELAKIHEFGLGAQPERSFLRGWIDENQNNIRQALRYWNLEALKGRITFKEARAKFAAFCVHGIQARIRRGIAPPLFIDTFNRKKGPHPEIPLIDSEQLYNAIVAELDEDRR
jgi:hypothetical protein